MPRSMHLDVVTNARFAGIPSRAVRSVLTLDAACFPGHLSCQVIWRCRTHTHTHTHTHTRIPNIWRNALLFQVPPQHQSIRIIDIAQLLRVSWLVRLRYNPVFVTYRKEGCICIISHLTTKINKMGENTFVSKKKIKTCLY